MEFADGSLDGSEAQRKVRYLHELRNDPDKWIVLYVDREARTLWKELYPRPEAHGGGPPRLEPISRSQALSEFGITEFDLDLELDT